MMNETKKCNKCEVEKNINEFSKNPLGNYRNTCERCREYNRQYSKTDKCRAYVREYRLKNRERRKRYELEYRRKNKCRCAKHKREYYLANKDKIEKRIKEYRIANKEKVEEQTRRYNKTYYDKNTEKEKSRGRSRYSENKEKERLRHKKYSLAHPEKRRQYRHQKYYNDMSYRITQCLRTRVKDVLRGISKSQPTLSLLGCTSNEFKAYIEKQFVTNMSWDNYGKGIGKWNLDHIIPCSVFNLVDSSEQKQCFHFSNVRPLWEMGSGGNSEKNNKTDGLKLLYNNSTPFK